MWISGSNLASFALWCRSNESRGCWKSRGACWKCTPALQQICPLWGLYCNKNRMWSKLQCTTDSSSTPSLSQLRPKRELDPSHGDRLRRHCKVMQVCICKNKVGVWVRACVSAGGNVEQCVHLCAAKPPQANCFDLLQLHSATQKVSTLTHVTGSLLHAPRNK